VVSDSAQGTVTLIFQVAGKTTATWGGSPLGVRIDQSLAIGPVPMMEDICTVTSLTP
jgi:hypothetical protein